MLSYKRGSLWVLTTLVLAAIACFSCSNREQEEIRIAVNPWPGYEFATLAERLGYYRDAGLHVKIVDLQSTAEARRAFEREQVQVFAGTLVELLITNEVSPRKAKILVATDYSNGADQLLARPEIDSIKQLEGKRIGVEAMSLDTVVVLEALKRNGMTLGDVKLVKLPQNELPNALRDGKVDAVEVYPPNSYAVLGNYPAKKLFDTSQAPGVIVDILAIDSTFAKDNPRSLRKLQEALRRAQKYQEENPAAAHALIAENENLSIAVLEDTLSGIRLLPSDVQRTFLSSTGPIDAALHTTHAALREIGGVKNELLPTAEYLLNDGYPE